MSRPKNRPLTEGEIILCKTIFDAGINSGIVKIYHESYFPLGAQQNNTAMAPNGNIYFDPAGTLCQVDFSKADIYAKALFIHEMTHVWQHQHGVNVRLRGIYQRNYEYLPCARGKAFEDYGLEQQADIVRDYF